LVQKYGGRLRPGERFGSSTVLACEFNQALNLTQPWNPEILMYLKHYGLSRQPFNLSSDPSFLWAGKKHKAALEALKGGILENKGFVLLTGDVGTGKSTLVNAFPKLNEIATISVTIPDPGMDPLDFCNFLASEFKMKRKFARKEDFVQHFKGFLLRSFAAYTKVLVIIDEAQRLDHFLLEEVRQLAIIEMAGRRLLKIFFIGQPEFCTMLMDERSAAVRNEIVAAYNIEPLDLQEAEEYIVHRLAVAGLKTTIFTPRALGRVYSLTAGFPRTINVLCDHALLRGYAVGTKVIDIDIVAACARALSLRALDRANRTFVFPFPLRTLPNDAAIHPRRAPGQFIRPLMAAAVWLTCLLALGFAEYHFGMHHHVIRMVQRLIASDLP
jgi:type II secretory pathway predicted ATPase ExeA